MAVAAGVVERYLAAVAGHDWDGLRECLGDGVVRVGPYGDTYRGRDEYVSFLEDLMPSLPGYEMVVRRVTYAGRLAFAEISETVEVDGRPRRTPEALTFELDDAGRIARVEVYLQTPT